MYTAALLIIPGRSTTAPPVMRRISWLVMSLVLAALMHVSIGIAAESASDAEAQPVPALTHADAVAELKRLQSEQDRVKQLASSVSADIKLSDLNETLKQLDDDVDKLNAALTPQRAQLQAQVDLLGPPADAGTAKEAPAVVRQRAALSARKAQLDDELKQAAESKENIAHLQDQLAKLQRSRLKDQLALRSESILNPTFWTPLFKVSDEDRERLGNFTDEIGPMIRQAWDPSQRGKTVILLCVALAVWSLGRRLLERGLAWFCLTQLPETRIRRSALALATALTTVVTTAIAVRIVYAAMTGGDAPSSALQDLMSEIAKLTMTSALIAGLGRALLCTRHPSWRLPALADPVALAMKPFPTLLAGLLLLAGTVEQLNRMADTSGQVTLLGRGRV